MWSIDDMFSSKNALNSPTNSVEKERKTEAEYKRKRKGQDPYICLGRCGDFTCTLYKLTIEIIWH